MAAVAQGSDRQAAAPEPSTGDRSYRADIQGLRAVAVLLVVTNHLVDWPTGGFIGVDVFFVISGFLITSSLLAPTTRSAPRVVADFYRRRARRILPAAVVTLVTTVLVARILFSAERADRVLTDALWSGAFAANWHFGRVGTDYFDSTLPPSPLQHFWTLSVEEQFYLVWPVLVITTMVVTLARRRGRATSTIAVLAGSLAAAGFAWSWHDTLTQPVTAYFSTASRGWELAVGALLATLAGPCRAIPHHVRELMAIVGLVAIVGSAISLGDGGHVPAPGAAPAVIAAALLLAAGTGPQRPLAAVRALTVRPMRHVGDISYSVYLWHWPAIVFIDAVGFGNAWLRAAVVIALTGLLAETCYHFVEQPFLPTTRGGRSVTHRRGAVLATVAVTIAAVAITALPDTSEDGRTATESGPDRARPPSLVRPSEPSDAQAPPAAPLVETLGDHLRDALDRADFPRLNPPIDHPADGVPPELEAPAGCLNPDDPTDSSLCTYPPAAGGQRLVVIIGDSVALSWLPGIRAALAPEGYTVHAITFSSCPPALVVLDLDPATAGTCTSGLAAALDQIDELEPDLVIGSALQESIGLVEPSTESIEPREAYVEGLVDVGARVRRTGADYVLLGSAPAGPSPLTCGGALDEPGDCVTSSQGDFEATLFAFAQAAQSGFGFINTKRWFCVDVACPVFADGVLIRWDVSHITEQYSEYLAPLLRQALAPYTG
ncbi:SGNH hydrolase domain-containing protein [soil metagenome]